MTEAAAEVLANSVVAGMTARVAPATSDGPWSVDQEWPSFSARFFLLTNGDERIALKLGTNWSPENAPYVAAETERVRRIIDEIPSGGVYMPAVLGVSTDPPALALEFRPGGALFTALAGMDEEARADILIRCGEAIGAYHGADPAPEDPKLRQAALDELDAAARRSVIRGSALSRVEQMTRARGYRFSPNDFLVDDGGGLVLLDPPHVKKYDFVHRDIASFFMELHRSLIGEAPPRSDDDRELLRQAKASFLVGYRRTGPDPLDTQPDMAVIDMFQVARISGVAQRRLRPGSVGPALRAISWWRGLRKGLHGRLRA